MGEKTLFHYCRAKTNNLSDLEQRIFAHHVSLCWINNISSDCMGLLKGFNCSFVWSEFASLLIFLVVTWLSVWVHCFFKYLIAIICCYSFLLKNIKVRSTIKIYSFILTSLFLHCTYGTYRSQVWCWRISCRNISDLFSVWFKSTCVCRYRDVKLSGLELPRGSIPKLQAPNGAVNGVHSEVTCDKAPLTKFE